jgi:prepilin-type N-terminal cleavage/methylation domain-containing protein
LEQLFRGHTPLHFFGIHYGWHFILRRVSVLYRITFNRHIGLYPMTNSGDSIDQKRGFTLVEMAIVLMIVGLLLGGLLVPLSAQMEQRNNSDTQKALSEIKEAIIGYALVNGHLPCPAKASLVTGSPGAGTADCTQTTGVVPWATLGTIETDAWGRRFTYTATSVFTAATPTFTLSSIGGLTIKSSAGGSSIAIAIPAVIVSHGKNGAGAYMPQGNQLLPLSTDPDEADNTNSGTTFVSHDFTSTFDDLVVWISPNILFNRMVAAGKLP